ncbi:hypothetical protein LBMAG52_05220 [Planctomycetia bacterium]|nr:hypothetical protein LBMAG52_05220 [Planctomycetia bacterium]
MEHLTDSQMVQVGSTEPNKLTLVFDDAQVSDAEVIAFSKMMIQQISAPRQIQFLEVGRRSSDRFTDLRVTILIQFPLIRAALEASTVN